MNSEASKKIYFKLSHHALYAGKCGVLQSLSANRLTGISHIFRLHNLAFTTISDAYSHQYDSNSIFLNASRVKALNQLLQSLIQALKKKLIKNVKIGVQIYLFFHGIAHLCIFHLSLDHITKSYHSSSFIMKLFISMKS